MSKSLYPRTADRDIAGLRSDVESLKKRPYGLAGIRFNVLNDSGTGGFLDVSTNDYISLSDTGSFGVTLSATSAINLFNSGGTAGININQTSGSGGVYITDSSSDGIYLNATHLVDIQASSGGITLKNNGTPGIFLWSVASDLVEVTQGGPIILFADWGTTEATVQVRINAGNYFVVSDNTPTIYFRVQDTGTFIYNLPTSSPGVTGQLWNSAGTVKIA